MTTIESNAWFINENGELDCIPSEPKIKTILIDEQKSESDENGWIEYTTTIITYDENLY